MGGDDGVRVESTLTREQVTALGDILDQLEGTPLARTGDIAITLGDVRYVISTATGSYAAAVVVRDGNQEVVGTPSPYRRGLVAQVAGQGLERSHDVQAGTEFTLRELIGDEWDDLSAVEQRNAGKRFRQLLEPRPLGPLDERKTSDNEWHYTRR